MFGNINNRIRLKYQMLSLQISGDIEKGGDNYDKKRNISIYYNITTICSCNTFTSKIEKST